MLVDVEAFEKLEEQLNKTGKIENFEKDYGEIKGRMMITLGDIPDELGIITKSRDEYYAFIGSFDFYDASVGIAIYKQTKQLASGVWITPQVKDADPPSDEWIEFFIRILVENVIENDDFGIPVYSFITDESDMTIVPML